MRRRRLGRTEYDVSILGFGASPLGNVFGEISMERGARAVHAAIARGINFFDVSPYYGMTLAEERLGNFLQGKRLDVVLATKCGRYGVEDFDFSAESVFRSCEASLKRLRVEHVDLLQAHDIEFANTHTILTETIPAMRRLQEQGKVRYIGITSYWPELLARVASSVDVDCVLNYCHSNLFVDDMAADLLPFTKAHGVGLINASPLHMGLLGGGAVPDWHPAPGAVRDRAKSVRELCQSYGVDPAALAIRFCADHSDADCTLLGLGGESEVDTACQALLWDPPPELLASVQAIIAPVHNAVWPSGLTESQPRSLQRAGAQ